MRIELKTAPAVASMTRDDVKTYAFIKTTKYDDQIDAQLTPCTEELERYTGRKMIDQSWYIYLDAQEYYDRLNAFNNTITLSTFNVSAITEVLTYSMDNTSTAITASDYRLSGSVLSSFSRLVFNDDTPPVYESLRKVDSVRIEVVAGYGASQASIPDPLQTALKMLINHRVKFPSKSMKDSVNDIGGNYLSALQGYRSVENWA